MEINMITERQFIPLSGLGMFVLLFVVFWAALYSIVYIASNFPLEDRGWPIAACILLMIVDLAGFAGLFKVEPNQGVVLTLFGQYKGTVRTTGRKWENPV